MWIRYVTSELRHRRRQALSVLAGLAVAVAVVLVIGGVGAGLRQAQSHALSSLYGVGVDVTVTHAVAPGTAGPQFSFSGGSGTASNGTTTLTQSQVSTAKGVAAFDASALVTAAKTPRVSDATGALRLDNYDFSGIIPNITGQASTPNGEGGAGGETGGSSFGVDSFTVTGIDLQHSGPAGLLTATKIISGRGFTPADTGQRVSIVDSAYALENQITVGMPLNIAGVDTSVIGLISSTTSGVSTGSNAYLPLDTAQKLSNLPGKITHIYVKAASASDIPSVSKALGTALPDDIVNTQADLASSVTGSLAATANLSATLGGWLSLIALIAATLFAALFTLVGVTRRTREFGTLKAIGWKSGSIVIQVAGEALAQGIVGAIVGVGLGAAAIAIINVAGPQLNANLASTGASANIPLVASFPSDTVAMAVGLAIVASLVAATIGAIRVTLLRPSEALASAE